MATTAPRFQHRWGAELTVAELDAIAETDDGLLYLDHLRGKIEARRTTDGRLKEQDCITYMMLNDYLDDEPIARDLARLIRDHTGDRY